MFRSCRTHFHPPVWAWAGANDFLIAYQFHHGRRGRGRHQADLFGLGDEPEPRARRGDIKFLLLALLAEQPGHGYDLIKRIETRYGGFRRLSPGSVYPTLQLLEDGGYVTSEAIAGKRVYAITETGRQFLAERSESADRAGDTFNPQPAALDPLRQAAMELSGAVMQVARSGNGDRINRVQDLLDRTKREIYAMLAEE